MTILFNGAASAIGAGPWNTSLLGPFTETSTSCIDNAIPTPAGSRRCTLVTDPLGIKGQVVMSDLRVGDSAAISSLPTSYRSELSYTGALQAVAGTFWTRCGTLIRSPWVIDSDLSNAGRINAIFQIHDTPDGGDIGRPPPFELYVQGSNLCIDSAAALSDVSDGVGLNRRCIWSIPLAQVLDVWQDWVVKATWNYLVGNGSLTIWRNRRIVFQEIGQKNCYNDVAGLFVASGMYVPTNWPSSPVAQRIAYTTGIVIGDNAETFTSFTGASELEQVTPVRLSVATA